MGTNDPSKLIFLIAYFMCMVAEIFVPCYYGTVLIDKSKELTDQIYSSNWINQKWKYKQAMMIFVERTLRPIRIRAGGLFLLNLQTFLSVNEQLRIFFKRFLYDFFFLF